MNRRGGTVATFLACLLVLALGPSVRAHQGHPVLRAERTIKLEADGERGVRVVITINYGSEEMLRVVRAADRSGDGRIEPREVEAYMDRWEEELHARLPMRIDGVRERIHFGDTFFEPKGPISLRPGTVEIEGVLLVPPGRHELVVTDDMAVDTFDRTDVIFTSTNDARLAASGPTEFPLEIVPSFAYGRTTDRARVRGFGMVIEMPRLTGVRVRRGPIGTVIPAAFLVAQSLIAVAIARLARAMKKRDAARGRAR